jgi:hypothetical protein
MEATPIPMESDIEAGRADDEVVHPTAVKTGDAAPKKQLTATQRATESKKRAGW